MSSAIIYNQNTISASTQIVTVQDFPKSESPFRMAGWIRRLAEEAMTPGRRKPQEVDANLEARERLAQNADKILDIDSG